MKKIVALTDFSPATQEATRAATRLATDHDAALALAHAWSIPPAAQGMDPSGFAGELIQLIADDAKRSLAAAVADAKQQSGREVSEMLLSGSWSRLVDAVEADPTVDLVVMGTHGRTGLKRILLGSVAEKVVRHAPCSVLVVREDSGPPFTDVLCSVDFSTSSRFAAEQAAALVRPGGSGITLLHVVEAPVAYSGEALETSFLRGLDTAAASALDDLATKLRAKVDVPVTTRVRIGYAGSQILALLDDEPTFDLVVMGSHGRTGLRRMLLGSVAEKIVRHAACSVLIARDRTA